VATELFARRGFAAVSLRDIAQAVGVTKAALYYHFPSKDDLYWEVLRELLNRIGAVIREETRSPSPTGEKIRRLTEIAILGLPPDAADLATMVHDAHEHLTPGQSAEVDRAHRGMYAAMEELMIEGITRGELSGDPRLLAYTFWQVLAGFVGPRAAEAGWVGQPRVAEAVADLFLHGAGARPTTLTATIRAEKPSNE
jgi:AcrR family transcriptional regulator